MEHTLIDVVAQRLNLRLAPGATQTLLPDSEYAVREVISMGMKLTRHGKRRRLCGDDVLRAIQAQERKLVRVAVSFGKLTSPVSLTLDHNGRMGAEEKFSALVRVYSDSASQCAGNLSLTARARLDEMLKGKHMRPRIMCLSHSAKATIHFDGELITADALRVSFYDLIAHERTEEMVCLIAFLTHVHACAHGNPQIMNALVRSVSFLLPSYGFQTGQQEDTLLRCALTLVLGIYPEMKEEKALDMRKLVAVALGEWRRKRADCVATGRVCKTLVAALLDPTTCPSALLGAIVALDSLTEFTYESLVTPNLPALFHGLEQCLCNTEGLSISRLHRNATRVSEVLTCSLRRHGGATRWV